jgi:hypothetical protein
VGDPNNPLVISSGIDGTPDYEYDGFHVNVAGAQKLALDIDSLIQLARGAPRRISVDLDPWSDENIVLPLSNDLITVAFLSTSGAASEQLNFDSTQINPDSVRFGLGEAVNVYSPDYVDFNGDNQVDVLLGFQTEASGIACGDTEVALFGETYAGEAFIAEASIDADACVGTGCHP